MRRVLCARTGARMRFGLLLLATIRMAAGPTLLCSTVLRPGAWGQAVQQIPPRLA